MERSISMPLGVVVERRELDNEAEGYLEGDDVVEAVAMPDALIAWVQAFVDRHHVDQPFVKRKRERAKAENRDAGDREDRGPATMGLFLLHRLGHADLALYDASMAEWARDETLPIERG
ncbi:MAG: DUF3305 domain-containing protein [Geminicoccaceae bacterium]